jgi:hypothetical protein
LVLGLVVRVRFFRPIRITSGICGGSPGKREFSHTAWLPVLDTGTWRRSAEIGSGARSRWAVGPLRQDRSLRDERGRFADLAYQVRGVLLDNKTRPARDRMEMESDRRVLASVSWGVRRHGRRA